MTDPAERRRRPGPSSGSGSGRAGPPPQSSSTCLTPALHDGAVGAAEVLSGATATAKKKRSSRRRNRAAPCSHRISVVPTDDSAEASSSSATYQNGGRHYGNGSAAAAACSSFPGMAASTSSPQSAASFDPTHTAAAARGERAGGIPTAYVAGSSSGNPPSVASGRSRSLSAAFDTLAGMAADFLALGDNHPNTTNNEAETPTDDRDNNGCGGTAAASAPPPPLRQPTMTAERQQTTSAGEATAEKSPAATPFPQQFAAALACTSVDPDDVDRSDVRGGEAGTTAAAGRSAEHTSRTAAVVNNAQEACVAAREEGRNLFRPPVDENDRDVCDSAEDHFDNFDAGARRTTAAGLASMNCAAPDDHPRRRGKDRGAGAVSPQMQDKKLHSSGGNNPFLPQGHQPSWGANTSSFSAATPHGVGLVPSSDSASAFGGEGSAFGTDGSAFSGASSAFQHVPQREPDAASAPAPALVATSRAYPQPRTADVVETSSDKGPGVVGGTANQRGEGLTPMARLRRSGIAAALGVVGPSKTSPAASPASNAADSASGSATATAAVSSLEYIISGKRRKWRERQKRMEEEEDQAHDGVAAAAAAAGQQQQRGSFAAAAGDDGSSNGDSSNANASSAAASATASVSSLFKSLAEGAGAPALSGAVRKPADLLKGMMSQNCRVDLREANIGQVRELSPPAAYQCQSHAPASPPATTTKGENVGMSSSLKVSDGDIRYFGRSPSGASEVSPDVDGDGDDDGEDDSYAAGSDAGSSSSSGDDADDDDSDSASDASGAGSSSSDGNSSADFPKAERGRSRPKYDGTVYTNAATQRRAERLRRRLKAQERHSRRDRFSPVAEMLDGGVETRRLATGFSHDEGATPGRVSFSPPHEEQAPSRAAATISPVVGIKKFVRQITTEGVPLIWHRVITGGGEAEGDGDGDESSAGEMRIVPTPVWAYVLLEDAPDDDDDASGGGGAAVAYSEPCLTWSADDDDDIEDDGSRDSDAEERRGVRGSIGLFDIESIEPSNPASENDAKFFVTLNGGSGRLLFEVPPPPDDGSGDDEEETGHMSANRVMNGLRRMIARLAFNVVIGNAEVCSELLNFGDDDHDDDEGGGREEERRLDEAEVAQAMRDVTNHLVDKAATRSGAAAR